MLYRKYYLIQCVTCYFSVIISEIYKQFLSENWFNIFFFQCTDFLYIL